MSPKAKKQIKELTIQANSLTDHRELGEATKLALQFSKQHEQMFTDVNYLEIQKSIADVARDFDRQMISATQIAAIQLPEIDQLSTVVPQSALSGASSYTAQVAAFMDALQLPAELNSIARILQPPKGLRALIEATNLEMDKYAAASQAASVLAQISAPSKAFEAAFLAAVSPQNLSELKSATQATYEMRDAFKSEVHGAFSIGASNQYIRAITADTRQQDFEAMLQSLEKAIQQSTKSEDVRFWLGMFFQIFVIILSQYLSIQTEDRLNKRIDNSEQRIIEKIEESEQRITSQIELVNQYPAFVVTAKLNLRTGPSERNRVIQVLSPNQPVTYISMKGAWMKVEFFDYIDNKRVSGWVHRDYLKPVERF